MAQPGPQDERRPLTRPADQPSSFLRRQAGAIKRCAIAASYPLRGIWFFVRSGEYWPLFFGRLLPLSLISCLVYLILFTFAFLPQLAFLAIFQGRGAWVNATFLVLGEGLVIIQGLFEGFFVDECRVDVFDATLIKLSWTDLVSPHRVLYPDAPNAVKMLGKPTSSAVYTPWSIVQIVELACCLPLNFIPWFGTPMFVIITGTRLGKLSHYRWFQLRGFSKQERKVEAKRLAWEDVWFGTVAMILELIPILSFFFLLTTTAGAAMWTVRIEEGRRSVVSEEAERAGGPSEQPPAYTDVV
ncbi:uncharacterized protein J7T54_005684 [Emericellopsis cladophorae]|uniref:Uncharacterized protein n=1 Tax=Emericellopsis cladophorae TaxID=2686198 RepID=A0A9P9Y5D6_9HYPO|nr:uncharacterized protein J7T54_005684 [Emericellopsis cladophorae]KAI6783655.1 hypothetical protein J7T54_005684 [Emericellopsis cladophorae]